MENIKDLVKFGNAKLPKTTMIFNMGTSKDCPSRKKGLCSCAALCYARKPERIYPSVLPYRERQAKYWQNTMVDTICWELSEVIRKKRIKPTHFRFNESGDFYSQECIEKMSFIAEYLLQEYDIVTYGYTARKDLDFSNASFIVKGSNNNAGNHGKTVVIKDKGKLPKDFHLCPGDCKACSLCSAEKVYNIAFIQH